MRLKKLVVGGLYLQKTDPDVQSLGIKFDWKREDDGEYDGAWIADGTTLQGDFVLLMDETPKEIRQSHYFCLYSMRLRRLVWMHDERFYEYFRYIKT